MTGTGCLLCCDHVALTVFGIPPVLFPCCSRGVPVLRPCCAQVLAQSRVKQSGLVVIVETQSRTWELRAADLASATAFVRQR